MGFTGGCDMNIRTEQTYALTWVAYDSDTYDCDCDQDGFFSTCPVGSGASREAAVADFLERLNG